jgi:hypothetical protein
MKRLFDLVTASLLLVTGCTAGHGEPLFPFSGVNWKRAGRSRRQELLPATFSN